MSEKKARLFYFEEAYGAFVPWDDNYADSFLEALENGETLDLMFKRIDMTDEEYRELPEP